MDALENMWGDLMVVSAANVTKKDFKLKNGDEIPKGTAVQLRYLGPDDPNGTTMCELSLDWTGPSGRNYQRQPMKTRILVLPSLVSGVKSPPGMSALERMSENGTATTPTGKRVEPDGYGPDGSPSWLLVLGYI